MDTSICNYCICTTFHQCWGGAYQSAPSLFLPLAILLLIILNPWGLFLRVTKPHCLLRLSRDDRSIVGRGPNRSCTPTPENEGWVETSADGVITSNIADLGPMTAGDEHTTPVVGRRGTARLGRRVGREENCLHVYRCFLLVWDFFSSQWPFLFYSFIYYLDSFIVVFANGLMMRDTRWKSAGRGNVWCSIFFEII